MTQRLREFLELYPEIRIELVLSDEQIWQLVEYLMDEGRKRKASGE